MPGYRECLSPHHQDDSSSSPDCGMDPQDVPHLFDCIAHPNDLSPVNLWDKPDETIPRTELSGPGQPGLADEDG